MDLYNTSDNEIVLAKEVACVFTLAGYTAEGSLKGIVPPTYYLCLLSAAAFHGAAHQRAATVLSELVNAVDMSRMEPVFPYTSSATLQRLGYLLEVVLEEEEKANELYRLLKTAYPNTKRVLLSNSAPIKIDAESNRWHVNGNIDIETDEL